jgi:hypothetical protein
VYKLWNGNSFDGANIEAIWMTKAMFGLTENAQPAMSQRKRWRWVDFLFETEQTTVLTVEWLRGAAPDNGAAEGSTTISPAAVGILTVDGSAIVTADGSALIVAQLSTPAKALTKSSRGVYLHDEGMRLRVRDNSTNGSWSLEAMNVAYQILPGNERRMP